ncbi:tyrosine/phenylalanine carboxypeptidase domain-containing protein [Luteimonas sp. RIT-PG2_3]
MASQRSPSPRTQASDLQDDARHDAGGQTALPAVDSDGVSRQTLAAGGRVHLDRPLPFLLLSRYPDDPCSLAHRVATISPASVMWPEAEAADAEALGRVLAILERQRRDFPGLLLLSLYDLPRDRILEEDSPRLERFDFIVGATDDAPAQAAADRLGKALQSLRVDQRTPKIEPVDHAYAEPGLETLVAAIPDLSHLSLGLPQVHRVPGEEGVYPQVFHALESAVLDALLQACAAFVEATTPGDRPHHRSLGRSSFIDAAVAVDRELSRISHSFDFLLGVSPINTVQARQQYQADDAQKPPQFRYRPLTISPERGKRALHAIDVRGVEDPVLETLFLEKQRELDLQLTMLQVRNTPAFRHASAMQYGTVEPWLREAALHILEAIHEPEDADDASWIDCHAVQSAAQALIARYHDGLPDFIADACLRKDIAPGLMVSGNAVLISTETRMRRERLDALLQHEISVHVLTCVNGRQQGLSIFGAGLAGYEGIQEGLGVFAEYAVGGLTAARLRLLAARVLVVDAMHDGAGFIDCDRLLRDRHAFAAAASFDIVARVFRSGGLGKDAIYLRGLKQVFDVLAEGHDLGTFWFGKIALQHVPMVEELRQRGILRAPMAIPEFLSRPTVQRNLARVRAGIPFVDLLRTP